jgi:hypothetical protein
LPAVLEELATALRHPLSPEGAHCRELARDVFPHVQRFYDGWMNRRGSFFTVRVRATILAKAEGGTAGMPCLWHAEPRCATMPA